MVRVFITVDTEVWPIADGWPHTPLPEDRRCEREIAGYFYGGEGADARGVPWQLETLAAHGLKASYFVDPLFSFALGIAPLRALLRAIVAQGQEVALHLHPEWLTDRRVRGLPPFAGPLLHAYSAGDQRKLVRAGLDRLAEAGAPSIAAFRAGSWGANLATLDALAAEGIRCDTSLNARFDVSFPDLDAASKRAMTQPARLGPCWEFPVASFVDRPPAGRRPVHVCAVSYDELAMVLDHAHAARWYAVVIVMHGFEFSRVDRLRSGADVRPQRLIAERFGRLCGYLAKHRDRFETCHFRDLDPATLPALDQPAVPRSTRARTAWRQVEQLASRFY